ncbi:MAG TPA: hypothetical protein VFC72_01555 [Corynebacterium sp.]|nr:hypothetical protein [Corynebacterium sp.]
MTDPKFSTFARRSAGHRHTRLRWQELTALGKLGVERSAEVRHV